jgi:predicted RNase H-related nuclease YkuK (DUF458 family)
MPVKTFTGFRPAEDQFIEIDDHEGNTQSFKLNGSLPGKTILNFMFVSSTDESGRLAKAIEDVLDKAIIAEDKERWNAFIEDERNGITISVLSEIVGHVTSVLSGNQQGRE